MHITDPIADMLTRIRNANNAKHETVDVPASNMKKAIAQILLDEGYIKNYQIVDDGTPVSYTHLDVYKRQGKGYAGVIKRWNAQRTPMSHGGGPVHRHAGSMGACSTPSRIFKGKIGAGHLGVEQVTVQNLDVVKVDPDLNMIVVRGAIPGPKGGLVYIHSTVKTIRVKNTDVSISNNPQKASGRNPQKASARNK